LPRFAGDAQRSIGGTRFLLLANDPGGDFRITDEMPAVLGEKPYAGNLADVGWGFGIRPDPLASDPAEFTIGAKDFNYFQKLTDASNKQ